VGVDVDDDAIIGDTISFFLSTCDNISKLTDRKSSSSSLSSSMFNHKGQE